MVLYTVYVAVPDYRITVFLGPQVLTCYRSGCHHLTCQQQASAAIVQSLQDGCSFVPRPNPWRQPVETTRGDNPWRQG